MGMYEGDLLGLVEGEWVWSDNNGLLVGFGVGELLGFCDGWIVGVNVGDKVGYLEEINEGFKVG